MNFNYDNLEHVLILGLGDIGRALSWEIKQRNPQCSIIGTVRSGSYAGDHACSQVIELDPLGESSWKELVSVLKEKTDKIDLIIATWGYLHDQQFEPEKSLRDINLEYMAKSFSINAFTAPLSAQHLHPFLSQKTPSVFCFLSAKVGSISDNRLGGWYSYRASKAALNMFLKSISIELTRKKKLTSVMAIHPGTTETKLSAPFLKNFNLKVWPAKESAKHICNVIESSYPQGTGLFKNWDHTDLTW